MGQFAQRITKSYKTSMAPPASPIRKSRLTAERREAYKVWRHALHLRIRQHNFARKAIAFALGTDDPEQEARHLLPDDPEGIERIAQSEDHLRSLIARILIIQEIISHDDWSTPPFTEALGIGAERIRQLRDANPNTVKGYGLSLQRSVNLTLPKWKKRKKRRALQKQWSGSFSSPRNNQNARIAQLIALLVLARKEDGITAYDVNMLVGNSDLPSRKIEWKMIELNKRGKIKSAVWADGRRKLYVPSETTHHHAPENFEITGLELFFEWLSQQPRQQRNTGLPEIAPDVTISGHKNTPVSLRSWIGLPEPPSMIGGQDLSRSTKKQKQSST